MWLTFETGDMRSKDVAAAWALSQLPEEHRSVLRHARSVYLGEADEDWGGQQENVRAYADTVVATIGALDSHCPPKPVTRCGSG